VAAGRQGTGRIAPCSIAVRRHGSDLGCPIEHFHRADRLGGTRQAS
jgi:hypothetical protein